MYLCSHFSRDLTEDDQARDGVFWLSLDPNARHFQFFTEQFEKGKDIRFKLLFLDSTKNVVYNSEKIWLYPFYFLALFTPLFAPNYNSTTVWTLWVTKTIL